MTTSTFRKWGYMILLLLFMSPCFAKKPDMKRILVLIALLFSVSICHMQAADIEPRTGIIGGDIWGLQTGAYVNFPTSNVFSIQTGALLHTANENLLRRDGTWRIDLNIPVYASFHIPLSEKIKLRLNGGAYWGTGPKMQLGATAEAGVEVKRLFVGANCFQNCINEQEFLFGVSVGYKFQL